ncbi:hypothetical protein BDB01DRAFT_727096 [Pilobolus umbonatus]|nr:hypothetical protein BDB01DRAFT_727096 [Pilobolus umbonatus]
MNTDIDYYALLGVEFTATTKQIARAYRSKALAVHPDRNPSPEAGALFHQLKEAAELLQDVTKRTEYDLKYKARLERNKKKQEMDSKRRTAQDELERREKEAKKAKLDQSQAKTEYEAELAKLRAEGAKRRQEDWPKEEVKPQTSSELDCALKVTWKKKKYDFTVKELHSLFSPFGKIETIELSQKKKGRAFVIFKTVVDAHKVVSKQQTDPSLSVFESIYWVTGKEPALVTKMHAAEKMKQESLAAYYSTRQSTPLFPGNKSNSFFKPKVNYCLYQCIRVVQPISFL